MVTLPNVKIENIYSQKIYKKLKIGTRGKKREIADWLINAGANNCLSTNQVVITLKLIFIIAPDTFNLYFKKFKEAEAISNARLLHFARRFAVEGKEVHDKLLDDYNTKL